jgi:hypothetical protein
MAPHYLRFAQALALVSGIAAPACSSHHVLEPSSDASTSDAPPLADAGTDPCATCECVFGGDMPDPPESCAARGALWCCGVIGPLAPPELPA